MLVRRRHSALSAFANENESEMCLTRDLLCSPTMMTVIIVRNYFQLAVVAASQRSRRKVAV
jgi:hypothetical protein